VLAILLPMSYSTKTYFILHSLQNSANRILNLPNMTQLLFSFVSDYHHPIENHALVIQHFCYLPFPIIVAV
jgi:hypothetical protein